MAESGPKACGSITDDIGGEFQSRTGFQSLASGSQGVLALFREASVCYGTEGEEEVGW